MDEMTAEREKQWWIKEDDTLNYLAKKLHKYMKKSNVFLTTSFAKNWVRHVFKTPETSKSIWLAAFLFMMYSKNSMLMDCVKDRYW
jgi:hypothetical protein